MVCCALFLLAAPAMAQDTQTNNNIPSGKEGIVQCGNQSDDPCTVEDIFNVFIIATNLLIGLVSLFAIYGIFSAGFTMTTSGGSAERLSAGKKSLVNSVIGMLLVFLAFIIVNVIVYALVGARNDTNIFSDPLKYIRMRSDSTPDGNTPPDTKPWTNGS